MQIANDAVASAEIANGSVSSQDIADGAVNQAKLAPNSESSLAGNVVYPSLGGGTNFQAPSYSPETVGAYKAMLRGFMTWLTTPDAFPTKHYPPIVAWISCHVRKCELKRLSRHGVRRVVGPRGG